MLTSGQASARAAAWQGAASYLAHARLDAVCVSRCVSLCWNVFVPSADRVLSVESFDVSSAVAQLHLASWRLQGTQNVKSENLRGETVVRPSTLPYDPVSVTGSTRRVSEIRERRERVRARAYSLTVAELELYRVNSK